jgi:phosphopentomutase
MQKRALLIVLDSVGIGAARDAADYGDAGADTLGHILGRFPNLEIPTLRSLGLSRLLGQPGPAHASFGRMLPRAKGKDSTTGHWEISGAPLTEPFGLFEHLPHELIRAIEREAGVRFIGGGRASGTQIIDDLGPHHLATGDLILYTSADSVLQIAAHEGVFPLGRLYDVCRIARRLGDAYRIGRVIARPFAGEPGHFTRTGNRHDFSMRPPRTVLDALNESGFSVVTIGKVADLFDGQGVTRSHPTGSNAEGMVAIAALWPATREGLLFANLVEFDTEYGHRRDVAGYARALEAFDRWLATFLPQVAKDDLLLITADHGNDPTYSGTDHTRENVPLLVRHAIRSQNLGDRQTFADVAATLAAYFRLPEPWPVGRPLECVTPAATRPRPTAPAGRAGEASPNARLLTDAPREQAAS